MHDSANSEISFKPRQEGQRRKNSINRSEPPPKMQKKYLRIPIPGTKREADVARIGGLTSFAAAGAIGLSSVFGGGESSNAAQVNIVSVNPAHHRTESLPTENLQLVRIAPGTETIPQDAEKSLRKQGIDAVFRNLTSVEEKDIDLKVQEMMTDLKSNSNPGDFIRVLQYRNLIEQTAQKYGVDPRVAEAIMLVESRGIISAESDAGAAGLWQLMPDTAREMGLSVNAQNDDRFSVLDSTNAAMKYLASMKKMFPDTGIEILAYNLGPGNASQVVEKIGTKSNSHRVLGSSFYKNNIEPDLDSPLEARQYPYKVAAAIASIKQYEESNLATAPR
jgi:hypothetical protein